MKVGGEVWLSSDAVVRPFATQHRVPSQVRVPERATLCHSQLLCIPCIHCWASPRATEQLADLETVHQGTPLTKLRVQAPLLAVDVTACT